METPALLPSSVECRLRSEESVAQYEDDFKRWLGARSVIVESLKDRPEVEQLFRHDFDNLRAWEQQQLQTIQQRSMSDDSPDSEEEGEVREDAGGQAPPVQFESCVHKTPTANMLLQPEQCQTTRSRCELLKTEVASVDRFNWRIKHYGPNGYMDPTEMLSPIAIVLRPGETVETYEKVFQKWLWHKKLTLRILLNHPEEERRYRQCYAYSRVRQLERIKEMQMSRRRSRSRSRSPNRIHTITTKRLKYDERLESPNKYSRSVPRGTSPREYLTKPARLNNVKGQFKYHKSEPADPRKVPPQEMASCFPNDLERRLETSYTEPDAKVADLVLTPSTCAPETPKSVFYEHRDAFATDEAEQHDPLSSTSTMVLIPPTQNANLKQPSEPFVDSKGGRISDDLSPNSSAVLLAAAEILTGADGIVLDPVKSRLVEHYIRVTEQIVVNETAINDALVHVAEINEEEAVQLVGQVAEAMLAVNEVKIQRDKVLAGVVAYEWSGKAADLDKQGQSQAEVQTAEAGSHQGLVLLYEELLQSDKVLQDLRSKLEACLEVVDSKGTAQDAQIDDVAHLIRQLSAKLAGNTRLKSQCEALSIGLLRCSPHSDASFVA
ncbi:uncharacterized protein PITG_01026 [Phytophthora infestans T30-4]|uniref:Uncharacterized protein n=1 Tax=Phytophthora infestans (strain T30-4) TaxID=403677 RepID=D0MS96_PHYIT|nr:uncharacterized protein PITG_01026 [Phytophthora infestans T30-4]EEY58365.1 conserved hypothetical protein [Phytophthora infestans T30-4]|eukprot:XP_002909551.1 conserved hypothetical protein [Phytophthora infestans T30-4]